MDAAFAWEQFLDFFVRNWEFVVLFHLIGLFLHIPPVLTLANYSGQIVLYHTVWDFNCVPFLLHLYLDQYTVT